ncbi:Transposase InsO and inactivated derivatives [Niabella drilacis]|uniref:Transposase InsO and inactivated derivatives n=1 Tax=Niabella drilacis (strain DSM 25811 / CCM 8410 / CCUG 62505 / LMG 26954 / E90) TaxID=1285928 RepID=A0A1G6UR12_NIADE|nr:Transposase InsO and inactivated derivatives [Niabella drilacis]
MGINRTLEELGIHKRTFYNWYHRYRLTGGFTAPGAGTNSNKHRWNQIPQEQKNLIIELALNHPTFSPRELAIRLSDEQGVFVSESSVYRLLKQRGLLTAPSHIVMQAADEFNKKTLFPNEMWQTDFTYFKVKGWGWYYLSTVLDDYSRYIIHWELCTTMQAEDVKRTVLRAMGKANLKEGQRPKLLSDNGSCYIAGELKSFMQEEVKMKHIHGAPAHPQTQGKIERYHRTMKNVVKLEHYFLPEHLIAAIEEFVRFYNKQRYHESLNNLTPEDVYLGRGDQILQQRKIIKEQSLKNRYFLFQQQKTKTA